MIFVSIGLPSPFAEWCDNLLCTLVRGSLGAVETASGNTLDEIGLAAARSRAAQLIIGARQPDDDLRAALAASGRRFIVALDDPYAAFFNLVRRHGMEWRSAVRATASSCASMLNYRDVAGALVVEADREGREPIAAATAIARWLGLEIGAVKIRAAVGACAGAAPRPATPDRRCRWEGISAGDRAIVEGALAGYVEHANTGKLGPLTWTRELFFVGDEPHAAAGGAIEVGGPVRNLVFGPYIALPQGRWQASVVLAVSQQATELPYSLEVLAGPNCDCLARATIEPRMEGAAEFSAEFTVSERTAQPISVRVANLRPALAGKIALTQVTVAQRIKPPTEIPAALRLELGLAVPSGAAP